MQLPLYTILLAPNLGTTSATECDRDRLITDIIVSGVIALSIDILEDLRGPILNNYAATIDCEPAIVDGAGGDH